MRRLVDPAGTRTLQRYDQLGRMTSRTVTPRTRPAATTTLTYDLGRGRFGKGRVTGVSGPEAAIRLWLRRERQPDRDRGDDGGRDPDLQPRLRARQAPRDGHLSRRRRADVALRALRRAVGRAVQPAGAAAPLAIAAYDRFTPGAAGRAVAGNGVTTILSYDDAGRLTEKSVDGPGGDLISGAMPGPTSTALAGRDGLSGGIAFGYDGAGRLTSAGPPAACRLTYDDAGNLAEKDGVDYVTELHQVVSGIAGRHAVLRGAIRRQWQHGGSDRVTASPPSTATTPRTAGGGWPGGDGLRPHRARLKAVAGGPTVLIPAPNFEIAMAPDGGRQHSIYLDGGFGVAAVWTKIDAGQGCPGPGIPSPGLTFIDRDEIDSVRRRPTMPGGW